MQYRKTLRHDTMLKVMFGQNETDNFGFLKDISNTGMRIKSNCYYERGELIVMDIYDNDSKNIMFAEGHVAWSKRASNDAKYSNVVEMGVRLIETNQTIRMYTKSLMTA